MNQEHGTEATQVRGTFTRSSDALPFLGAGRPDLGPEAIASIERAHAEVEEAESSMGRRFAGPAARQRLERARQAEVECLGTFGFDSYSDYLFGLPSPAPGEDPFAIVDRADTEAPPTTPPALAIWPTWGGANDAAADPITEDTVTEDTVTEDTVTEDTVTEPSATDTAEPAVALPNPMLPRDTALEPISAAPHTNLSEEEAMSVQFAAVEQARTEVSELHAQTESLLAAMQTQASEFVATHMRQVEEEARRVTDDAQAAAARIIDQAEARRRETEAETAGMRSTLASEIGAIDETINSMNTMVHNLADAVDALRREMATRRDALVADRALVETPVVADSGANGVANPWAGDPSAF